MKKYIIYKATGGLTHMLKGLAYTISIAKQTKRNLIIDCKKHGAFMHHFSDFFTIQDKSLIYSDNYNGIPNNYKFKDYSIEKVKNTPAKINKGVYYVGKYKANSRNMSNMSDNVIIYATSGSLSSNILNIKVIDKIKKQIIEDSTINDKYLSLHFRNTDRKNNITVFINKIKTAYQTYQINTVYLATDDATAYDKIKNSIDDNINLIQYTKPGDFGGKNIHYNTKDKYKLIYNCLLDIYNILNSTYFIPSTNSGLSKWIMYMIKNKKDIFDLKSQTKILLSSKVIEKKAAKNLPKVNPIKKKPPKVKTTSVQKKVIAKKKNAKRAAAIKRRAIRRARKV